MKQRIKQMYLALVAIAAIGMVGCTDKGKEKTPEDNPQQLTSLVGTAWVGVYNDVYNAQGGSYPAVLTWNLDFLTETEGEFTLEMTVGGQAQTPVDLPFTYTFDGTRGTINSQAGLVEFTYNAEAQTLTMELVAGDELATMGGETVFHPRGYDPGSNPGEVTEDFPANTEWLAKEKSMYHLDTMGLSLDIPMEIEYHLVFNNNHQGMLQLVITLEVEGMAQDPQTQALAYEWTYNGTNGGDIIMQGAPFPYTIDFDANTLTMDASFSINGGNQSVGGNTVYDRVR